MTISTPRKPTWRKSSRSSNGGGQCVEVAALQQVIAVRDSTQAATSSFPFLTVTPDEWEILLESVKNQAE